MTKRGRSMLGGFFSVAVFGFFWNVEVGFFGFFWCFWRGLVGFEALLNDFGWVFRSFSWILAATMRTDPRKLASRV